MIKNLIAKKKLIDVIQHDPIWIMPMGRVRPLKFSSLDNVEFINKAQHLKMNALRRDFTSSYLRKYANN